MSKVLKFDPVIVGEGFRFDADDILESWKEQSWKLFAILGELEDGTLVVTGNANAGETLVLMERAKHKIIWAGDE